MMALHVRLEDFDLDFQRVDGRGEIDFCLAHERTRRFELPLHQMKPSLDVRVLHGAPPKRFNGSPCYESKPSNAVRRRNSKSASYDGAFPLASNSSFSISPRAYLCRKISSAESAGARGP